MKRPGVCDNGGGKSSDGARSYVGATIPTCRSARLSTVEDW